MTKILPGVSRKTLAAVLLASFTAPLLSGCFPVVAGGVAVGAMAATDRRTVGAQLEDKTLEQKINSRIDEKFPADNIHVDVSSFNRQVLLAGEVPDDATKAEVERIARGVPNVRMTFNELVVGPQTTTSARANDAYITTKVKGRMLDANKFSPTHVKVVTENGVVYLMGLLKRQEAADATEVARTTAGVKKVVTGFFEYLD